MYSAAVDDGGLAVEIVERVVAGQQLRRATRAPGRPSRRGLAARSCRGRRLRRGASTRSASASSDCGRGKAMTRSCSAASRWAASSRSSVAKQADRDLAGRRLGPQRVEHVADAGAVDVHVDEHQLEVGRLLGERRRPRRRWPAGSASMFSAGEPAGERRGVRRRRAWRRRRGARPRRWRSSRASRARGWRRGRAMAGRAS